MIKIGLVDNVCSITSGLGIKKSITRAQGRHLHNVWPKNSWHLHGTWPEATEMPRKAI